MKNDVNILPAPVIFSPIPLDQLVDEIFKKLNNQPESKEGKSHGEEILTINEIKHYIKRSRPSINKYIRQKKIRVHYFDDKSPFFIKSEFLEDAKSLPGFIDKD